MITHLSELVVSVGDETFVGRERGDHVSEGRQGLVDALCLLQAVLGRPRLIGSLGTREIDQGELAGSGLLRRLVVNLLDPGRTRNGKSKDTQTPKRIQARRSCEWHEGEGSGIGSD